MNKISFKYLQILLYRYVYTCIFRRKTIKIIFNMKPLVGNRLLKKRKGNIYIADLELFDV